MSFCPISIVIFFGLLIPRSYRTGDPFLIPAVFAIAASLPVLIASLVLVTRARLFGRALTLLQDVNVWIRLVTGAVFLIAGMYYIPRFPGF